MELRTNVEILLNAIANNTNESVAPGVVVHIDDTVKHTGPFYAIQALTDALIDVDQCDLGYIENAGSSATQAIATNINLPQGMTIYGSIDSVELDSGSVLAYARAGVTVTVDAS